ncbi:MAG: signal recognition particle protein [Planctomycetota bacterium]|nr:MAG: signal recognition particle protein [Planctomycetota bacterium]
MFESLSEKFQDVFTKFTGRGKLTEKNIQDGLKEVKMALLEADVNYKVVKEFIKRVKEEAIGQELIKSIKPGQQFVKIVHDKLTELMGPEESGLKFAPTGPTVIMMAGLQGSGKTTTCAKLAVWLKKQNKKPYLVAADVQRPAAIDQLKTLGEQIQVPVYSEEGGRPTKICQRAIEEAKNLNRDVVILDTAGRLHIDQPLMDELKEIQDKTKPHNILLVCDAMTGQDAVNSAKEFNDQLEIDGIILTKLDGDARGGAAISIKHVTGKPIKFVGVGEKVNKLEVFHPDRMADRILGMGDIVSLVEQAQEAMDREKAEKLQQKLLQNKFDLEDFLVQMQQIKKMGSIKDLLSKIPGMGRMMQGIDIDDKELARIEAIILSMTPEERRNPDIILKEPSRKRRIARGSGMMVHDVNGLLKQFKQMTKMIKKMNAKGGLGSMMNPFGGFNPFKKR